MFMGRALVMLPGGEDDHLLAKVRFRGLPTCQGPSSRATTLLESPPYDTVNRIERKPTTLTSVNHITMN